MSEKRVLKLVVVGTGWESAHIERNFFVYGVYGIRKRVEGAHCMY